MSAQALPRANESAVIAVRPKVLFGMIEERFAGENVEFRALMPPTAIGSLTLLEGALLASLVKLSGAKRIFEFGTYKGGTSVLLALNSADDAHVTTLDIDPDELATLNMRNAAAISSRENDALLRTVRANEGAPYVQRAAPETRAKITQIVCDSTKLDIDTQGFRGAFDLIFIDGGHDAETVRSDSEKAFAMAKPGAVIAWHDYGSSVHTSVTDYVDALSFTRPIARVEHAMLAICWAPLTDGLVSA